MRKINLNKRVPILKRQRTGSKSQRDIFQSKRIESFDHLPVTSIKTSDVQDLKSQSSAKQTTNKMMAFDDSSMLQNDLIKILDGVSGTNIDTGISSLSM